MLSIIGLRLPAGDIYERIAQAWCGGQRTRRCAPVLAPIWLERHLQGLVDRVAVVSLRADMVIVGSRV